MNVGSRKWWALGALTLAVLTVGLDSTILSVTLPTLAGALHASESDLQWFQSSYLLILAAAMLPVGLIGDRYGRKMTMLVSLGLFGMGSAACAYSGSAGIFIVARVLLGLAGAGVIVMALSALTVLFTEEERPRAVGVWAAANFLALPIGPVLGGWLLSHYWWGWVFLVNVPVAVIGLLAASVLLPESRASDRGALDWLGIAASTAGFVGLTYGIIEAGQHGWGDPAAIAWMVGGVLVLVGFFFWEARLDARPGGQPMIDLALFRSRAFTWGVILAAAALLAMIGVLFTMPQYFQGILNTDAMGSGLRLLPLIGGLALGAVPADRLAKLIGSKVTAALGFAILAAGMAVGATTKLGSSGIFVDVWMAVTGVGMGMALATAASAALSELTAEQSGIGSAVMQAFQKVGAPLGSAIVGSVLSSGYIGKLALNGLPPQAASAVKDSLFSGLEVAKKLNSAELAANARTAFVHGMDLALLVSTGIAAVSVLLTLLLLPSRREAKAADESHRAGRRGHFRWAGRTSAG